MDRNINVLLFDSRKKKLEIRDKNSQKFHYKQYLLAELKVTIIVFVC